jgi:hypothetical protein
MPQIKSALCVEKKSLQIQKIAAYNLFFIKTVSSMGEGDLRNVEGL